MRYGITPFPPHLCGLVPAKMQLHHVMRWFKHRGATPSAISRLPGDVVDIFALVAAVIGPLCLYVYTMPRTISLEDDGLFIMSSVHLGTAHPPGYPLHTLLSHPFFYLPIDNPAFIGHLSSAVFGALASGALYLCARLLLTSWLPALIAAWLFAASEHVWSQAIITEVYTLNALLLFTVYALILYGIRQPQYSRVWTIAAIIYGLSLGNHWPLMILASLGLALAAWPARKMLFPKLLSLLGLTALAAALPYAWMVWRSLQQPLISFYGPISNWDIFWFYISRRGYSGGDTSDSADWSDRLGYVEWFGQQLLWQLTPIGCTLALLGLVILWHQRRLTELGSSLLILLGNSIVLILLLGFDFEKFRLAIFRPYSLACYGIEALWLALGTEFLLRYQPQNKYFRWCQGGKIRVLVLAFAGGMIIFSVRADWHLNHRANSEFVQRYADTTFSLLPSNATMFVHGDVETAPLGYYRFVEQRRTDVTLIDAKGLIYGKRLYGGTIPKEHKVSLLERFIDINIGKRTMFFTFKEEIPHSYGVRHHGFLMEIFPDGEPGSMTLQANAVSEQYFEYLIKQRLSDSWEQVHRNRLLYVYGYYLGFVVLSDNPELQQRSQVALALAQQNSQALTGMVEVMLERGDDSRLTQTGIWLKKAQDTRDAITPTDQIAHLVYLQGFLQYRLGNKQAAIAAFRKSNQIYPSAENPSVEAIETLSRPPPTK